MSDVNRSAKRMTVEQETELRDAIDDAATNLESAKRKYLQRAGWKYSSSNPPCLWMWERTMPDGRTIICNAETAIRFQEAM